MKAIFNCDKNWGIGKNNNLLFHLPKDMKFFSETTKGGVVVMGYNTMLSLGVPLKNRINVVLSSKSGEDFIFVKSLEALKALLFTFNTASVFIIGGARLFTLMLPYCTEALVTKVEAEGNADVFVENLDNNKSWEISKKSEVVEDNGYNIQFITYKNKIPLKLN